MTDRPLLLFPKPENASRDSLNPYIPPRINKPSTQRQYDRLQPSFQVLTSAFENKRILLQNISTGIEPEFALVFEVIGTVNSFYTAVKHVEGMEWLFDFDTEDIEPDEDFSYQNTEENEKLSGIVYCVMASQHALKQMLSLWSRYTNGETKVFERGFSGLRDVFLNIKIIRRWDSSDRIRETKIFEYWKDSLSIDGDVPITFEIELFYRSNRQKQINAYEAVKNSVDELQGRIIKQFILNEIAYHSLLVELPRNSIQSLIENYNDIELVKVDDIMIFRPRCQSMFKISSESYHLSEKNYNAIEDQRPVVALFDGMPIQNHKLLSDRVIIDDPDELEKEYDSKYRVHGTAMSSLIIYGDLNRDNNPINRPIYIRPILLPEVNPFTGEFDEATPKNDLLIDIIHRSVKRLYESQDDDKGVAPSIKVINLSIGDAYRQFALSISPFARLIDWLSYKYNVLFLISAGNQNTKLLFDGIKFDDFASMSLDNRSKIIIERIKENQRNLKVLTPAESINALTVGALFNDFSHVEENGRNISIVNDNMPSPYSGFGFGYKNVITPDLFYYGGRKLVKKSFYSGDIEFNMNASEPGCKVAAPFGDGTESGCSHSFGTSDATAQLSHEACQCYDIINEIYLAETGYEVPPEFAATILKAMVTHGASWESANQNLSDYLKVSPKKLSKWLGNGIPDISKVEQCTRNRVTIIGTGSLKRGEAHVYELPLPLDFSSKLIKRKLTATLAYFSPINNLLQKYRGVNIWFEIIEGDFLVPDRQNTEWQRVRKGTLQHEIFTGERAVVWGENSKVVIKVNCREDALKNNEYNKYALVLSFEAAEAIETDVYATVLAQIKGQVSIRNI